MIRAVCAVLAAGFAISGCAASGDDGVYTRPDGTALSAADIHQTVERHMDAAGVPGLTLALVADGEVVFARAYGWRDVANELPLQTDTVMHGASLTKAAFGYMVVQLADEGLVDLDASIADLLPQPLPEYERYGDLEGDERWRLLTPRILLSHTSGLPNWRWFLDDQRLVFFFEPGERYVYSGEGLQILQLALEEGLGLDIGEEMQARVFDRFGMTRTAMSWREDFADNFAHGYTRDGEYVAYRPRNRVVVAGSMDTTLDDYAAFLAGLTRREGLSDAAFAELTAPQIAITSSRQFPSHLPEDTDENADIGLSYGLGWGIYETPYGRAIFKEGNEDGTNNYALCLIEAARCLLILSNRARADSTFLYLANALLGETGLPWAWKGYVPYDHAD
ncbi:serine hydrolase domain-containing protein [Glycocaulis abyssi]|uniref:Serine hydrolase domain-containing protein n=1 Tax=Glycocaulis abyssi TaxID=1433403 RepID=A0ABV9N6I3_9PROT